MTEKVTKTEITESMEAKWRKLSIILYGIFLFILLFVILIALLSRFTPLLIGVMFPAIVSVGVLIYKTVQYVGIVKHAEDYEIYEVLLDRPVKSMIFRKNVYFTVGFNLKGGTTIMRNTKPIWSDTSLAIFQTWEYMNAWINVAYDEKRDRLLVLGLKGERF